MFRFNNRVGLLTAAVAVLVAVSATACAPSQSSPAERAVATARGDSRIPRAWRDGEARTPIASPQGDWFVVIDLNEPSREYPLDICSMPGIPETFDAIVWQISPDGNKVSAVSPLWGELSCLAFPVEPE